MAPSGLSLTARAGGNGAAEVGGPEADLDALVQRLAESVYRLTQPYRYGVYLATNDRKTEAVADIPEVDQDRFEGGSHLGLLSAGVSFPKISLVLPSNAT